jgi:hypothetical protein
MPTRLNRNLFLGALAILVLAATAAGCGSSGGTTGPETEQGGPGAGQGASNAPLGAQARSCPNVVVSNSPIRVAGASCDEGSATVVVWSRKRSCLPAAGASRSSCSAGRYRCLATRAESSISVNCSRPQRSISFLVEVSKPVHESGGGQVEPSP